MKHRLSSQIHQLILAGIVLALAGCANESATPGDVVEAPKVFPTAPPDGPAPEIGPAPETYLPTASGAPSTDIWIGRIEGTAEAVRVSDLRNLTDREGYDNQPHFASNDLLYYVSVLESIQSDVFSYQLGTPSPRQVTRTEASEFSPNAIPGQDAFSAIYELRGKQYLWRYESGGYPLGAIFATAEPVGYQAWADEQHVAMFILGGSDAPATLQVGNAVTGELTVVAERPGRSIHRIPGTDKISFVRKLSENEWWIEQFDPVSGETQRLQRTLPGREDYAWTPDNRVIMGDGTTLSVASLGGDWIEFQDLSAEGLKQISRLAISPSGQAIAIVSNR